MNAASPTPPTDAALCATSATALARLIREGECSSQAVVEAHLARMERRNPDLGAVMTSNAEEARRTAAAADAARAEGTLWGPLHGVPITVKDGFATKGLRSTFGLVWYGQRLDRYEPPADAATVAALRDAGAVILGKTTLPLGSYDWQSNHPLYGRANNPHDLGRTPGGSSGGSAAAVAAGLSPLGLASDAAGSIRVPAHFCGVCSMRPTEGRVSTDGMMPPGHPGTLSHAITAGPMARCVADLRLAYHILADAPPPSGGAAQASPPPARDLRIAVTGAVADAPIAADVAAAVEDMADRLRDAGATVDTAAPPIDFEAAQRTWGLVHGYEFAKGLPLGLGRFPLNQLFRLGLARWAFGPGSYTDALTQGYAAGPTEYLQALGARKRLVRTVQAFLADWDVWIGPVAGVTAFPHCRTGADLSVDGTTVPYAAPLGVYNTGMALAGTPCVVLPIGTDREGLPIGVQVHARRWDDERLLDVAATLEQVLAVDAAPVEALG